MDRYDSYISSLARKFESDLNPEPRFTPETQVRSEIEQKESISKSWDKMSHDERNMYLYGHKP